MKQILHSEWERLWKRKITWLIFLSIPILLVVSANYLLSQNEITSPEQAQFTVAWNFPLLSLSEMLFTAFPVLILIIVAFTVTEEYRTGQLRMILIRSYSLFEIMMAKFLVTVITVLLFFVLYFLSSYLLGMLIFPKPSEFALFYHQETFSPLESWFYNLQFYGIAFLSSLSMISVLFFLATVSQTTTAAIGGGIGFLLFSHLYPKVLSYFYLWLGKVLYSKLFFTSILMIQWQGITQMIAEKPKMIGWNLSVIFTYILLFQLLTAMVVRKKDSFI